MRADSTVHENNWKENSDGRNYIETLNKAGRSRLAGELHNVGASIRSEVIKDIDAEIRAGERAGISDGIRYSIAPREADEDITSIKNEVVNDLRELRGVPVRNVELNLLTSD